MPASAASLRDLHQLHQRAKALRERLVSGPKTLAARQATLAARQAALADARKALQDVKVKLNTREVQLQGQQAKVVDLEVKKNQAKKKAEYEALNNQIKHDQASITKVENDILDGMGDIETQAAALLTSEADLKAFAGDVEALKAQLEAQAGTQKAQLAELEAAIVGAEAVIPDDQRERYRRTVKQRGADALAFVEGNACSGCFVTVTPQMVNQLINVDALIFCNTCGRILYLAEDDLESARARR